MNRQAYTVNIEKQEFNKRQWTTVLL